jgi:hypothetical protein
MRGKKKREKQDEPPGKVLLALVEVCEGEKEGRRLSVDRGKGKEGGGGRFRRETEERERSRKGVGNGGKVEAVDI